MTCQAAGYLGRASQSCLFDLSFEQLVILSQSAAIIRSWLGHSLHSMVFTSDQLSYHEFQVTNLVRIEVFREVQPLSRFRLVAAALFIQYLQLRFQLTLTSKLLSRLVVLL